LYGIFCAVLPVFSKKAAQGAVCRVIFPNGTSFYRYRRIWSAAGPNADCPTELCAAGEILPSLENGGRKLYNTLPMRVLAFISLLLKKF
jgi:hypothetical protein